MEYRLTLPKTLSSPVVFSSPHSGRTYFAEFVEYSCLELLRLRSSEDAFVDELFADAPKYGAALIAAEVPRAYVDLNRDMSDLDPALIEGIGKGPLNARVASGLGVIPRVVAQGCYIQNGKISFEDAMERLERFYVPYHEKLAELQQKNLDDFGCSLLFDCHSMPRESLRHNLSAQGRRPEIVLGDRFGSSASRHLVEEIETAFVEQGFAVARNAPFAGAHIARHYGQPSKGQHVIQIEIDRGLYMDEATVTKHGGFEELKQRLENVVAVLATIGQSGQKMAAE